MIRLLPSRRRALALTIGSLLMLFLYTALSIRSYSKRYSTTPSDVAIVLGAGTARGNVSKVYEQRILHSIQLFKKGRVRKIIFTGGYGEGQTSADSQAARTYALSKGLPSQAILIEKSSTITFYNLVEAKKLMQTEGLHTALIVSDPYHMKRAMAMAEKVGITALPSPTQTSMYRSRKTKSSFLIKEVLNYWAYLLVGQHRKAFDSLS